MDLYPNKCCRCGMCCLNETCPIGQNYYTVKKTDKCPGLSFENDFAFCLLVGIFSDLMLGIGQGCCIKARVFKDGVQYDFASLTKEFKQIAVNQIRREK